MAPKTLIEMLDEPLLVCDGVMEEKYLMSHETFLRRSELLLSKISEHNGTIS